MSGEKPEVINLCTLLYMTALQVHFISYQEFFFHLEPKPNQCTISDTTHLNTEWE